jgi:hypothetical protein
MLVDRSLRATVRNFSTLFLLAATITLPLHVAHAYVFREVIEVAELHPAIEEFPARRKVRGVGLRQLDEARVSYLWLSVAELVLLLVLVRPTARVLEVDGRHGVPSVWDAWTGQRSSPGVFAALRGTSAGPLLVGAALALVVGWLTRAVGLLVVEPLPDRLAFAGIGAVEGLCRALAAPFFLGIAAGATKDT